MKYLLAMLSAINLVVPAATAMGVNYLPVTTTNENQGLSNASLADFRNDGKEIIKLSCGYLNLNEIKGIKLLDKDIRADEHYATIQYLNYYHGTSFVINKNDYDLIYNNFTITKETNEIANRLFIEINGEIINSNEIKSIKLFDFATRTNENYAWIDYQFLDSSKGQVIKLKKSDYRLIYKNLVVTKDNTNIKDKHLIELSKGIFDVNEIKAVELTDRAKRTNEKYASLHYMDYYRGPRFTINRYDYWTMLSLFSISKENPKLENKPFIRLNEVVYNIDAVKKIELLDKDIRVDERYAMVQYNYDYKGPNFIISKDNYDVIYDLLVINKENENNKKPYLELSNHRIINTNEIKTIQLVDFATRTNEEYALMNYKFWNSNNSEVIKLKVSDYRLIYKLFIINQPTNSQNDDRNERFLIQLDKGIFNVNEIKFFELINQTKPNTGKWCKLYYEDYYQGSRIIISREDYNKLVRLITF